MTIKSQKRLNLVNLTLGNFATNERGHNSDLYKFLQFRSIYKCFLFIRVGVRF